MESQPITAERLKDLRWINLRIPWCAEQLDHGYLVCEESVNEWATQAAEFISAEEIEKALRAVENTRNILKAELEKLTRERSSLMAWIEAIPKEDVRACMFLHYGKGYTWDVIEEQYFGGSIGCGSAKKMCIRYLHGLHQGPVGRPKKRKEGEHSDT